MILIRTLVSFAICSCTSLSLSCLYNFIKYSYVSHTTATDPLSAPFFMIFVLSFKLQKAFRSCFIRFSYLLEGISMSSNRSSTQLRCVYNNVHILWIKGRLALGKKCPYLKFFWSVFSRFWAEYRPEKHQIRTLSKQCCFIF